MRDRILMTTPTSDWIPRTAHGLHDYLAGGWRLAKALRYTQGGVSGTLAGEATFASLQPDILGYLEAGQASLGSPPMTVTATQRYVWDFSDEGVRVLFDECAGERTPEAVMRDARFFHTVDLLALDEQERAVRFDHPCPCVAGGRSMVKRAAFGSVESGSPAPPQGVPGSGTSLPTGRARHRLWCSSESRRRIRRPRRL